MSSPNKGAVRGQQRLPARLFRSPARTVRTGDHRFFIECSQKASDLGTAAHLGGAEDPEPKGPFPGSSTRKEKGHLGLGQWPILPRGPRAWPGAQVIACSGGSAAGPPAGPQSLGPRSPGWRCSPGGRSAAPGGQGRRDVILHPGPHLALAEVWQSQVGSQRGDSHPGYTGKPELPPVTQGAPTPRQGPQSSRRVSRVAVREGHSESPSQWAQLDLGTGPPACSAPQRGGRTFWVELGKKVPDSPAQTPGVWRKMFPSGHPRCPGSLGDCRPQPGPRHSHAPCGGEPRFCGRYGHPLTFPKEGPRPPVISMEKWSMRYLTMSLQS